MYWSWTGKCFFSHQILYRFWRSLLTILFLFCSLSLQFTVIAPYQLDLNIYHVSISILKERLALWHSYFKFFSEILRWWKNENENFSTKIKYFVSFSSFLQMGEAPNSTPSTIYWSRNLISFSCYKTKEIEKLKFWDGCGCEWKKDCPLSPNSTIPTPTTLLHSWTVFRGLTSEVVGVR